MFRERATKMRRKENDFDDARVGHPGVGERRSARVGRRGDFESRRDDWRRRGVRVRERRRRRIGADERATSRRRRRRRRGRCERRRRAARTEHGRGHGETELSARSGRAAQLAKTVCER